ncbi:myosin-2 heavy chain-like [Ptychodera flava]|uniref:myosin-2 heavy chain-like n=1 Tax=Ptychodera flava TaxID=63121 RepID=UPI00396A07B4
MSNEKLLRHLHQCHLCLPAPCYSDYSLGGLESIAVGVPTMVFDDTHTASFITKYFLEHEENCIIRWQSESHSNYKQLSEKILSALVNMDNAFEKAKTLKNNLLNSKAIPESHARFASLLRLENYAKENEKEHTGVTDNTGKYQACESSIISGEAKTLTDESTTRELEEKSKATQLQHRVKKETPVEPIGQNWPEALKEVDETGAQTTLTKDVSVRRKAAREEMMQGDDSHGEHSRWTGYKMQGKETEKVRNGKKATTQETTGTDANGNPQAQSERGGDGDIGNYNNLQVNINLKEDDFLEYFDQQNGNQDKAKETWSTVNAHFHRNANTVVAVKQSRQMAENICKRLVGDVETTGITTESLGLQLKLPALFNLYKLEQTCRSGSFPSAFEPLLVTNKMKEEAAKVGIQLKLKATYDEERFRELELFFLNRDGGGLEPVEAHLEDIDDLSEEEVFTSLLLLEIDPALETKQSVIRRILNADKCTRLRGPNSTIMQLTLEITEKVHHILCCRPQILALLGVKRYLVAEPETVELTFSALEDNLAAHGTCVSPQNVEEDNCSLCVKSLLPFQMSSMHLNHYWVEHLLKLGQKSQFLKQQAMVVLQSQLEEAKKERDTLQERYGELQKESDLTEKEFSRRLEKKEMQLRELKSKVADMEQLQWAEFELQQVTREIAMTGRDDDKKPKERKGAATSDEFHRLTKDAAPGKAESLHPGKHSIDRKEVEKSEPTYQEIQRTEPVMDKERPLRHGGLETELPKAKKWKVMGTADLPIANEKAAVGERKSVVRKGKERKPTQDQTMAVSDASLLTRSDDVKTEPSDMSVTSTVEETTNARPLIGEEMPSRASQGTLPVFSVPRESPGNWSLKVLDGHGRKMIRKFKDVKGIAFNCDQLVVCDQGNSTVEILTRDYIRQKVLGSFDGQFDNAIKPADVAISPDNLIYILDKGNAQIIVCNLSNEILDKIPLPRDVDPKCIALMGKFVLVSDNNSHRLIKLTHDGQHSADIGGKGRGPTKFIHPNFVAVTSNNVVMVSDGNNHAIKCFDEQLQYLYQFGVRGGGDGELRFPSGICIDEEDNVYVCDCYNHRVVKWRPNGEWVCNLFQGELTNPWNCTISVNRIAIRELYRSQIKVFTKH